MRCGARAQSRLRLAVVEWGGRRRRRSLGGWECGLAVSGVGGEKGEGRSTGRSRIGCLQTFLWVEGDGGFRWLWLWLGGRDI